MAADNLDLLVAYADDWATFGAAHARWLGDFPVHFEPVGILFGPQTEPVMLVGPETLDYARLRSTIPDVRVLKEFTHPDEDYPFSRMQSLGEIVAQILPTHLPRRVGIAGLELMGAKTFASLKGVLPGSQWIDVEAGAGRLRAVKSPAEIAVIQEAYRIAELGFKAAVETVHKRGGLNSLWEILAFAGDTKVVWASLFRAVSGYSPEGLVILRKFCDRPRCD